jgi:hypothetical protein
MGKSSNAIGNLRPEHDPDQAVADARAAIAAPAGDRT